jgi:hypothetical protein
MYHFLSGAILMASLAIGLFFLRFWTHTHDRFFLLFAGGFWLFGLSRLTLVLTAATTERPLAVYLVRLAAFLVILVAIIDKNRARSA